MSDTDILIIGCGVAGATVALRASRDPDVRVTIITSERDASVGSTRLAQGGIVGSVSDPELLVTDIMAAGAGVGSVESARILAYEGPRRVLEVLVEGAGVEFDRTQDGAYQLAHEAAHSERRVLHRSDTTGDAIESRMLETLRSRHNVTIVTDCTAVDLIVASPRTPRCTGAYVLCDGAVSPLNARATVLATGGVGALYLRTTNPPIARGDGIAMASRAGARIAQMEYIQFHPTACGLCESEAFLISESVRGEGAQLLSYKSRKPFMREYDAEWSDLAPRDVVARAIHEQMRTHPEHAFHEERDTGPTALARCDGAPYVWLDLASHMPASDIRERFPAIDAHCRSHGLDMASAPIPVRPAAHYSCGGIAVDEWARTTIDGLYAAGEASCTGVHGANRLASTSLLEGVVWGCRAAEHIAQELHAGIEANATEVPGCDRGAQDAHAGTLDALAQAARDIMWMDVGLVRTPHRLHRAVREIDAIAQIAECIFRLSRVTNHTIAVRNGALASALIARAAAANPVSRGCHFIASDAAERSSFVRRVIDRVS